MWWRPNQHFQPFPSSNNPRLKSHSPRFPKTDNLLPIISLANQTFNGQFANRVNLHLRARLFLRRPSETAGSRVTKTPQCPGMKWDASRQNKQTKALRDKLGYEIYTSIQVASSYYLPRRQSLIRQKYGDNDLGRKLFSQSKCIREIVSMVLITTTIGVISTMIRHINRRKPARCSPGIRHAITALSW